MGKGERAGREGGELPFSRNASFRGVSWHYAWYKFERQRSGGQMMVRRSTDKLMRARWIMNMR